MQPGQQQIRQRNRQNQPRNPQPQQNVPAQHPENITAKIFKFIYLSLFIISGVVLFNYLRRQGLNPNTDTLTPEQQAEINEMTNELAGTVVTMQIDKKSNSDLTHVSFNEALDRTKIVAHQNFNKYMKIIPVVYDKFNEQIIPEYVNVSLNEKNKILKQTIRASYETSSTVGKQAAEICLLSDSSIMLHDLHPLAYQQSSVYYIQNKAATGGYFSVSQRMMHIYNERDTYGSNTIMRQFGQCAALALTNNNELNNVFPCDDSQFITAWRQDVASLPALKQEWQKTSGKIAVASEQAKAWQTFLDAAEHYQPRFQCYTPTSIFKGLYESGELQINQYTSFNMLPLEFTPLTANSFVCANLDTPANNPSALDNPFFYAFTDEFAPTANAQHYYRELVESSPLQVTAISHNTAYMPGISTVLFAPIHMETTVKANYLLWEAYSNYMTVMQKEPKKQCQEAYASMFDFNDEVQNKIYPTSSRVLNQRFQELRQKHRERVEQQTNEENQQQEIYDTAEKIYGMAI